MATIHDQINSPTESFLDAASNHVDLAVLTGFEEAQVEGEPDLVGELIDLYLEDATAKLAAMREAATKTNEALLKRISHSLRGSSANLGVRQMAALCDQLEQIKGNGSLQTVGTHLTRLEEEFDLVRKIFVAERQRRL